MLTVTLNKKKLKKGHITYELLPTTGVFNMRLIDRLLSCESTDRDGDNVLEWSLKKLSSRLRLARGVASVKPNN